MSKTKKDQKTVTGVFDSILEQAEFVNAAGVATVVELPLDSLSVNPHQPRKHFGEDELGQLASSVAAHGVLQPIVVRETSMGRYEIVVGERRFRAAGRAGLSSVPAIVREIDDETTQLLALVENLQRADLNPLEETDALLNLLSVILTRPVPAVIEMLQAIYDEDRGRSRHSAVAESERAQVERLFVELGRFSLRSFVTHRLPLLNFPDDVLTHVRSGRLDYTKATAVIRLKDETTRANLIAAIFEESLSLREIQQRVANEKGKGGERSTAGHDLARHYAMLGKRLNKSSALNDEKKRVRIGKLLAQLEKLLT